MYLAISFIIALPAFFSLLNQHYFSMHDDQHIARLHLLDQGIKQGTLFPRWVDTLGFGYGYPLFNFYPPLIYYLAEVFHLIGFSLIWSIKLMLISSLFLGALGMFLLAKKYIGRAAGFVSAVFYTYFTYHAIIIYVRGAFAENMAYSILPFAFLTLHNMLTTSTRKNIALCAISLALLILSHPLIAMPTFIFITIFVIFYAYKDQTNKIKLVADSVLSIALGLGLSAFFWLPSFIEKSHTLAQNILTGELANYKLHFVFPQQFWYSQWGYGGSAEGLADGISFQLGKVHIGFAILSLLLYLVYRYSKNIITPKKRHEMLERTSYFVLIFCCVLFSIFMSTSYSTPIWEALLPLWYIQFPWRFSTFTGLFISLCCGYFLFILSHLFSKLNTAKILFLLAFVISAWPIIYYQKYFNPQRFLDTNDTLRTSHEEIAWRISRSSYDFVPKQVATKKTDLNTTIVDITKDQIPQSPYLVDNNTTQVAVLKNNFNNKIFKATTTSSTTFQLNTYYFPGWKLYIDDRQVAINSGNKYHLITTLLPTGKHTITARFENTSIRITSVVISTIAVAALLFLFFYRTTSAKKM